MTTANVKQAVMKRWWIPNADSNHYHPDGKIRWCWLELGEAAIMLQEFMPEREPKEPLGTGVKVCFQCEDALALYRLKCQKKPNWKSSLARQ
ncbi:MAG: hypothetical protein WAM85_05145 [Terracidiphilus sp.]